MSTKRTLLFRGLLLLTLISCAGLTYGKDKALFVPIARNVAWNDLVDQLEFLPTDSPQDSLARDLRIIQNFLQAHESQPRVGIYDLEVFKAIDRARARLRKAEEDLKTIRNELSYREQEQSRAGDR